MASSRQFQSSRYELKFIIDEGRAHGIRRFVLSFLTPDDFTPETPGQGYPVHSLYLDSGDFRLCGQTVEGVKNRFKLRIRVYDNQPENPAFLEVKRRVNDVICKERALVTREDAFRVLQGQRPSVSKHSLKHAKAIDAFCRLRDRIRAKGQVYVSYLREAFVSPVGNELRVTFDRQLESSPYVSGTRLMIPPTRHTTDLGGVILELKFTNRFPHWMHQLVQQFDLRRRSVPKYVECVQTLEGNSPSEALLIERLLG